MINVPVTDDFMTANDKVSLNKRQISTGAEH